MTPISQTASGLNSAGYVRQTTSRLLSQHEIEVGGLRIEVQERKSTERIRWHYRQPRHSMFWYGPGFKEATYTLDKSRVHFGLSNQSTFCVVPADVEVVGEFEIIPGTLQYTTVIFLDKAIVDDRLGPDRLTPIIGLTNERLTRSLNELCRESKTRDTAFPLFAESWMYEALGHLARATAGRVEAPTKPDLGGLSNRNTRLLDDFIHANYAQPISLDDLSQLTGLSTRQLLRAFQKTKGVTPHQYIVGVRLAEARRLLLESDESITSIALRCGFSHAQHFSSVFRKMTGQNPQSFRRAGS